MMTLNICNPCTSLFPYRKHFMDFPRLSCVLGPLISKLELLLPHKQCYVMIIDVFLFLTEKAIR